ncbi:F0F1 ATP synthase subunit delta [Jiangella asiatica]|uniref:ATP synthase subunit delta n=1 Tax=Jiangella asiatica TaxID=2530372 RepID=A0A4R5DS04_9ACTN|nr:F0F1 ATP synthase subunit delta [Jiangella asiatica]TDE15030.1 F0F1 ATP synthase subunit delta [Jiangella asiatica]
MPQDTLGDSHAELGQQGSLASTRRSPLEEGFESIVDRAADRASAVGDALFAFANLLVSRPSVRRALTDTGRSADDREALLRRLVGERIEAAATDVLAAAVRERWPRPGDLTAAVEEFGVRSVLLAGRSAGRLDTVEEEIFRFGQVVRGDRELRAALIDRAAPPEARRQLVRTLLEGKAAPETVVLVEHAVLDRRERSLEAELARVADFAAQLRERRVAVVHVAAPLTDQHRERLERALATRAGGPVLLNVIVEPGLVGGIKVELGDEVVDGTVTSRLDTARRQVVVG